MTTVTELLQPVEADLEILLSDLRSLIGAGHPILQAAAEHLFSAGGKKLRPGIVLLISRALAADGQLTPRHRRLAEITEMIHTASLVHDDVVDEAATRRGVETVHSRFNHRVAPFNVLARPPPLTAAHFEQAFEQVHGLSIDALLSSALSHFKSAKSRLDVPLKADGKVSDAPILSTNQRNEAMALAKVAVANSVLIATLSMKPPAPGVVAQFSFSVHPHFVAISFVTPSREDGT